MKKLLYLLWFLLSLCFLLPACGDNTDSEIITDVDSEKVLSDVLGLECEDCDYVLSVGESKIIAIKLDESEADKNVSIASSNPFAVTAANPLNISNCAFVEIFAKNVGNSTVTIDFTDEEGNSLRSESVMVSVPMQEIIAAEFSLPDNEITLELGESLVDMLTVYSLSLLYDEDIELISSNESVLSVEEREIVRDEFSTRLSFKATAKSVGNSTLSAKLPDGTSDSLSVTVIDRLTSKKEHALTEAVPDESISSQVTLPENAGITTENAELTYVLNVKSKRFHYPECRGVRDMKEENKGSFYGSRDEAIAEGYTPCGTCKP